MKVCTDACLFGAWVAQKIESKEISPSKILDIGSGTGLLSLMLAQKTNAQIDAVEIVEEAFLQSKENIEKSPWKNRINIVNCNILDFPAEEKYNLIICNPPFYEKDLKSQDATRNTAMHSTDLSLSDLSTVIRNNLSGHGKAAILLPFAKTDIFKQSFNKQQLFSEEEIHISDLPDRPYFRTILLLSFLENGIKTSNISVKKQPGEYSEKFISLLKDFYLNF